MTPTIRKWIFETLYKNRYLYRFASTVPFAGQWRVWQRLVLSRLKGHDVLELGCGLGDLLADMLDEGYACRAVEHSPQMVAAARDTLKTRHVGDKATIIQGSAQSLPFSSGTFDTVVSTFPSEYVYALETVSEVARVLRPGGRFIVIEAANLLPVGVVQPILVLLQTLVYGPASLLRGKQPKTARTSDRIRRRSGLDHEGELRVDVIPNADFGRHIPLESVELQRRSERVRTRRWEVFITIGDKV